MPGRLRLDSPSQSQGASPVSPREDPAIVEHAQRRLRSQSPARARQTVVRNRRLRYLERHGSAYFASADLELADPLLYDRLIRQYMTPAEREAQGRQRGWSGVLEADLTRAEAKIAAVQDSDADTEARALNERGDPVDNKEEGQELWRKTMTLRFIEGRDDDFDYDIIDNNEEWDDYETAERDASDKYFDAETPSSTTGAGDTGILDY